MQTLPLPLTNFSTVSEAPEFVAGLQGVIVDQGDDHEISFVVSGKRSFVSALEQEIEGT